MKYVVSLIIGLTVGTAAALAIVYFNPLTRAQSGGGPANGWALDYELSPAGMWLSTHDRRLNLPVVPDTAPLLYEDGIRGAVLTSMPLVSAAAATPAAATRISIPSAQSEFLRSGLMVEDHWLISVPGEGSLYIHALNNQWPLLRDTVVRVDWLGREFRAPASYGPTRGPADAGADVHGVTGRYAGARGTASERLSLDSYRGSLGSLSGRLEIVLADEAP